MPDLSRTAVIDACRYLDRWIEFRQQHLRTPGVQIAVLLGDEMMLSSAHGLADVSTGSPLSTQHLFRIASHSKTFTATAAMQLVEQGVLRLDDTVGRWIDQLADSDVADRTVRELLSHSGGVTRDGLDGDFWQLFHAFPDRDGLLDVAGDHAAVLAPNERFKYSNIGYSLVGLIIEAAGGSTYHEAVTAGIVDRLGLERTGPELDLSRADEYAAGHSAASHLLPGGERIVIEHIDTGAMAAATGFFSTAEELVRYMSAHFLGDDRLLTDRSKRRMQRTEWVVEGTGGTAYGLGFAVDEIGGRRVLGHGGGYPGHITRTYFDPVDRLAVSALTNAIDGPALEMAAATVKLVDLANKADADPAASGGRVDLSGFEGRFATLWGVYDIVALGGRLHQISPTEADPTASPTLLDVVDHRTLRIVKTTGYGSAGETLTYERNDDGSVRSVRGGSGTSAFPLAPFREALAARERVELGTPILPPAS